MRMKIIGLIAAVALVAACETAPEKGAAATGAGAAAPAMMAQPSAAAPAAAAARPGGVVPGSIQEFVQIGDRVFFDFDKYNLKPDARSTLGKQADWLKKYPAVTVIIEGHCDERGTREYNLALGERRANAVKDYLVALGINPNRLKTISFGKERPEVLGSNEDAWGKNRRGVTRVTGGAVGS